MAGCEGRVWGRVRRIIRLYWETRDCDPPELPDDVTDIICKDNKVYHVKGSKDLYQRILINQGGWEMTHTLKYWYKVPRSEVNSLG